MGSAPNIIDQARSFLAGEKIKFASADAIWRELKRTDELSFARLVLQRMRLEPACLIDGIPAAPAVRDELCREEAMITSKDAELNSATERVNDFETA
jgi:hypothetical protein